MGVISVAQFIRSIVLDQTGSVKADEPGYGLN
jgi:hypothetical protein